MTSRAAGGCGFPVHQLPFTGMGVVVSLVSVIANAPAFTATGVAVSEGLVAYSVSSSLVVTAMFVLGGVVGGGDLFFGVLDDGGAGEAAEGHLHVGLAGGEPDVADEDVGEVDGCSPVDGEGVRAAGRFWGEIE